MPKSKKCISQVVTVKEYRRLAFVNVSRETKGALTSAKNKQTKKTQYFKTPCIYLLIQKVYKT
jgi:hypothetical protein